MFIDFFEQESAKINKDFDYATCNIEVHFPPNDEPQYGFFSLYMSCLLIKREYEGSDNVALGILAYDWNNKFTINADICWGHPSGKLEDEVFQKDAEVTDENLSIIKERLPSMILKLREALKKAQSWN